MRSSMMGAVCAGKFKMLPKSQTCGIVWEVPWLERNQFGNQVLAQLIVAFPFRLQGHNFDRYAQRDQCSEAQVLDHVPDGDSTLHCCEA